MSGAAGAELDVAERPDDDRGTAMPERGGVWWAVVVAAGFVGTLWGVAGRGGLFVDEAFSATVARLSFSELAQLLWQRELNGSLHYLLLWATGLGDESELLARLPSALAVGAAGVVVYVILRRYLTAGQALVGELIFLASPAAAQASVTVRFYGLVLLFAALLTWLVTSRLVTTRGGAVAYALLAGVSLYAHFFMALLIAVHLVWLWFAVPAARRRVVAVGAGVALFAVPIALFVAGSGTGQLSWITALTPAKAAALVVSVVSGDRGNPVFWPIRALLALPAVVCVLAWLRSQKRPAVSDASLLCGSVVAPLVVLLAVSFVEPILTSRYLWFLAVPFSVALTVGVFLGGPRWLRTLALVGLAVNAVLLLAMRPTALDETRTAVRDAAAMAEPGDAVIAMALFDVTYLRHYGPSEQAGVRWESFDRGDAEALVEESDFTVRTCLPDGVAGADTVYVVSRGVWLDELEQVAACSGRDLAVTRYPDAILGVLTR